MQLGIECGERDRGSCTAGNWMCGVLWIAVQLGIECGESDRGSCTAGNWMCGV